MTAEAKLQADFEACSNGTGPCSAVVQDKLGYNPMGASAGIFTGGTAVVGGGLGAFLANPTGTVDVISRVMNLFFNDGLEGGAEEVPELEQLSRGSAPPSQYSAPAPQSPQLPPGVTIRPAGPPYYTPSGGN